MTSHRLSQRIAAALATAVVAFALPLHAHLGGEQFIAGPAGPSAAATDATLRGRVAELYLDDRVTGLGIRYLGVVTEDGLRVRPKGIAGIGLSAGDSVQVSGTMAVWLMSGTTAVSSVAVNSDANWSVVDVADLNGDNRHDLVWRHAAIGESAVWLMNGTSMLSGATVMTLPEWSVMSLE